MNSSSRSNVFPWPDLFVVIVGLIAFGAVSIVLESLGRSHLMVAMIGYGIIVVITLCLGLFVFLIKTLEPYRNLYSTKRSRLERELPAIIYLAGVTAAFISASAGLLHYLEIRYGGFVPHNGGYFDWFGYAWAWALNNLFANFFQIFGVPLSNIQAVGFVPRVLVFGYNAAIELLFLGNLIGLIGLIRTPSVSDFSSRSRIRP